MKTFYQFLLEAPTPPPAAAGASPSSPPPGAGGPIPGGPTGGPPMGLGGPPMGGPSLGGPPMGGPSLGGLDGPQPAQSPSQGVPVQKYKTTNVWQALEKIIKNKNGQSQEKMINSEE